jgi:hypothetical protein
MKPWMWWALGIGAVLVWWKFYGQPSARATVGAKDPRLILPWGGLPTMSIGRDPNIIAELNKLL